MSVPENTRFLINVIQKIQQSQDITPYCQRISDNLSQFCDIREFYQLPFIIICRIVQSSDEPADVYIKIATNCAIWFKDSAPLLLNFLPVTCSLTYEQCISIISSFSSSPMCMKLKDLHNQHEQMVAPDFTYQMSTIEQDIKEIKNYIVNKAPNDEDQQRRSVSPCTFLTSGRDSILGIYYKCHTCGGPSNQAICPSCAAVCHRGHNLEKCSGSYYCDCGAHDLFNCQLVPGKVKCTYEDHGTHMISGIFYQCQTCPAPSNQAICPACAHICHKGHILIEHNGSYYCDCGAHRCFSCKLIP